MAQPADFGFDEEATLLRDSARKFFTDNLSTDRLHGIVGNDPDPHRGREACWDQALWQTMVELGYTMLAVPEAEGGSGMPAVAVAALCEEAGRAAFPAPLLATVCTTYVLRACASQGARSALEAIAGGSAATLAIADQHGNWESTPELENGGVRCEDGKLQGKVFFVQDAQKVQYLLVKAATADGSGLFWVDVGAEGVEIQPDAIVDLTRDQATVCFSDAPALALTNDARAVLEQAMPALWTMLAADMAGAGEWQLQTTVEYARIRKQFDRELGFFQAVKHPLVNVMIAIDETRSLVYAAACALDTEPHSAVRLAHMAQSSASDMAAYNSSRSVQFHGGIGFTWESYVHLYFKRQVHNQMLWGDAAWHRSRLADLVIGPIGQTA